MRIEMPDRAPTGDEALNGLHALVLDKELKLEDLAKATRYLDYLPTNTIEEAMQSEKLIKLFEEKSKNVIQQSGIIVAFRQVSRLVKKETCFPGDDAYLLSMNGISVFLRQTMMTTPAAESKEIAYKIIVARTNDLNEKVSTLFESHTNCENNDLRLFKLDLSKDSLATLQDTARTISGTMVSEIEIQEKARELRAAQASVHASRTIFSCE